MTPEINSEDLKLFSDSVYKRSIEVALQAALLLRFKDITHINVECDGDLCEISIRSTNTTHEDVLRFVNVLKDQVLKSEKKNYND